MQYNAMASHGGELLFLSAFGSCADLKVIRAVVNSNGSIPAYFRASGMNIAQPSQARQPYFYPHSPSTLTPSSSGYNITKHRLGFGEEHNLFVSRKPGFLLTAGDEAVWRELKSDRITTPVIREWLPYIASRLREENLLVECSVAPYMPPAEDECTGAPLLGCCLFSAGTEAVDEIVLDGLRKGKICIPSEEVTN